MPFPRIISKFEIFSNFLYLDYDEKFRFLRSVTKIMIIRLLLIRLIYTVASLSHNKCWKDKTYFQFSERKAFTHSTRINEERYIIFIWYCIVFYTVSAITAAFDISYVNSRTDSNNLHYSQQPTDRVPAVWQRTLKKLPNLKFFFQRAYECTSTLLLM